VKTPRFVLLCHFVATSSPEIALSAWMSASSFAGSPRCTLTLTRNVAAPAVVLVRVHISACAYTCACVCLWVCVHKKAHTHTCTYVHAVIEAQKNTKAQVGCALSVVFVAKSCAVYRCTDMCARAYVHESWPRIVSCSLHSSLKLRQFTTRHLAAKGEFNYYNPLLSFVTPTTLIGNSIKEIASSKTFAHPGPPSM